MHHPAIPSRKFVGSGLLALMVLSQWLLILLPASRNFVKPVSACLLLVFLPLAWVGAGRLTRYLFLALLMVSLWLSHFGKTWLLAWQALPDAAVFAAFLGVLQFMRFAVEQSQSLQRTRTWLAELPAAQRLTSCAVSAFVLGSFLNIGAHAVVASSLPLNSSRYERKRAGLLSLISVAGVSCWSPFFLALAFVTHLAPQAKIWQVVIIGLVMGLSLMLISLAFTATFKGVGKVVQSLLPLLPGIALTALVLVVMTWLLGLAAIFAIIVAIPVLIGVYFVVFHTRQTGHLLMQGWGRSVGVSNEILLITGAIVLAAYMQQLPLDWLAPWFDQLASPLLLMAFIMFMLLAGLVGLHSTITSTLLLTMAAGLDAPIHMSIYASAILLGWGLASATSPVGLTSMLAGQAYRIPYLELAFSRNLVVVFLAALLGGFFLALINAWAY